MTPEELKFAEALHRVNAQVGAMTEELHRRISAARQELAEARREIAALRGEPEGALHEDWKWGDEQIGEGWIREIPGTNPDNEVEGRVVMFAHKDYALIWRYTGLSDQLDLNERFPATSVREAMRIADEKAFELGLFGKAP